MVGVPALINVSMMWVDIGELSHRNLPTRAHAPSLDTRLPPHPQALRSMAGSKSSRNATKKRFNFAIGSFCAIFSLLTLACGIRGLIAVIMAMMVIVNLVAVHVNTLSPLGQVDDIP